VLEAAVRKSSRLRHVWADSSYRGELVEWWQSERGITIEIVAKREGQVGFEVLPQRWIVETTLPQYP
jgi:putative transposase